MQAFSCKSNQMLKAGIAIFTIFSLHANVLASIVTDSPPLDKSFRLIFINPGMEWQFPTDQNSLFIVNPAFGYGGSFPNLSSPTASGFLYDLSPKLTIQQLWFYNREKRSEKGRSISGNSGNFISLRLYSRGPSASSNFTRKTDIEFAVGPTWGLQRKYGQNFSLFFDIGPVYYLDIDGNHGFFPIFARFSLGMIIN